MSEKLKEALSAVIDSEADEFELRRVLDEIGKDPRLAASWERYHLIGAAMRRERIPLSFGMREVVWAEVGLGTATEAAIPTPVPAAVADSVAASSRPGQRRLLAVAATAAVVVIAGFLGLPAFDVSTSSEFAEVPATPDVQRRSVNESALALTAEVTAVDEARTQAYVIRHLQQLGMNRTGIGFTKMVAYERD